MEWLDLARKAFHPEVDLAVPDLLFSSEKYTCEYTYNTSLS